VLFNLILRFSIRVFYVPKSHLFSNDLPQFTNDKFWEF